MALEELARASDDLERIEVHLLLEAINQHYGFDFRGYALGSLKRRLWRRAYGERLETLSALQDKVLHDPAVMERLLLDLSIHVTAVLCSPPSRATSPRCSATRPSSRRSGRRSCRRCAPIHSSGSGTPAAPPGKRPT